MDGIDIIFLFYAALSFLAVVTGLALIVISLEESGWLALLGIAIVFVGLMNIANFRSPNHFVCTIDGEMVLKDELFVMPMMDEYDECILTDAQSDERE